MGLFDEFKHYPQAGRDKIALVAWNKYEMLF